MSDLIPWEQVARGKRSTPKTPTLLVDLRRCIGCHACSVACKVEHSVPLGDFRMRVRWLPRPDRAGISFVPLFDGDKCDFGANRMNHGLDPACVAACPTGALRFGDGADPASDVAKQTKQHGAKPFASKANTRTGVLYIGQEAWHAGKVNAGVPLSPDDEDIIYEQ